jgi:single-stranded-DNA-specific exonuclease
MTDEALEEIIEQIEGSELKKDKVLVVYKEELHESLAGILAGRIRERYNKPAYVITNAKDNAKGSGRSIEEYDMFQEISKCKDILIGAGGHPMAAGFSLEEKNISLFRKRLNNQCSLTEEDLIYKVDIDDSLELADITFDLVKDLERLEPFGKGNGEPKFMAEGVTVDRIFLMGQKQEHVKFSCRDAGANLSIQGVKFYEADLLKNLLSDIYGEDRVELIIQNPGTVNLKIDLLFKPSVNEWNNVKTIQMQIIDYRICQ